MSDPRKIFDDLKAATDGGALSLEGSGDDARILVNQAATRPALERLKAHGFNMLVDLTAVDYSRFGRGTNPAASAANPAPAGARFKLTYRLMRLEAAEGLVEGRIALQCWLKDEKGVPSVRDLWPDADWLEREVWDMFGVPFSDRPGIRRILLYEEFVGHPLRKDYPINKRQPLVGPAAEAPRDRMTEGDLRPKLTP